MINFVHAQSDYLGEDSGNIGGRESTEIREPKPELSAADSAWERMQVMDFLDRAGDDQFQVAFELEKYYRRYYKDGIKFWQRFPTDKRKYEWLGKMLGENAPSFWENIEEGAKARVTFKSYDVPINLKLRANWEKSIEELRIQYYNNPAINLMQKQRVRISELTRTITWALNQAYWKDKKNIFWERIGHLFKELTNHMDSSVLSESDREIAMNGLLFSLEGLFLHNADYGITLDDLREFVYQYQNSANDHIRRWVGQKQRLLHLNLSNYELFSDSIAGKQLDIEKFRNKVVLVDYWHIHCSTCLSRMPIFKSLYEKYHDLGFEVISVSIDNEEDKEEVEKINRERSGNWTHLIIGGKNGKEHGASTARWRKIWDLYGYKAAPQMILFNKNGELAMVNGPLIFGDPEQLIKKLLNE